ncbi:ATG8-interacting protein 1-like [Aristolochia californica]|uniref:ATG8-interacting protein 1-like n=1 Tax=Aristolochia californica TaxID=171875 RepID=UPI0035E216F8
MADENNDREECSARGNEWEVVSLTASTYAAAPGAREIELEVADKELSEVEESARAMFLSGHFVFPPNEHENLPVEPDIGEIHNEPAGEESTHPTQVCGAEPHMEGDRPAKSDEDWNIKGLTETDEVHGVQFFVDKCTSVPTQGTDFEEGKVLQGLSLVSEEESMYSAAQFRSFHDEAESSVLSDPDEQSEQNIDSLSHLSISPNSKKENQGGEPDLPYQAWWKRHITTLYSHAKETNALWSVVVAAALMGLVILGQRWQQEKWQLQQLRWQVGFHDENMNRILGPISRFKDVLVGGQRRSPVVRGSLAAER